MRRRLIALAAAGLVGAMALWFACGGTRDAEHPPSRSPDAPTATVREPENTPPGAAAASTLTNADSAQPARGASAGPDAAGHSANVEGGAKVVQGAELWRQIETASRQDLKLLASFERELGRVPPEAHELIRRRNSGATPAELRAWLQKHGPKELRARLILSRWLRESEGDGGAARVERAPLTGKDGGVPKVLGTLRKKDAAP
ncbi:MAG TPA: hypothetical protein VI072_27215 [Polyangiaceae bacterium]